MQSVAPLRKSLAWAISLSACALMPARAPAQTPEFPARVSAIYDVEFGGVGIGSFNFESRGSGGTYALKSDGKLSMLFGAIKWAGHSEATGAFGTEGPKPRTFGFSFKSSKSGSTQMAFAGNAVTNVTRDPDKPPKEGTVPVQQQHLVNVLDPMSAVLALSKATSGNPCQRKLAVYDGRVRFDLILSPKGTVQLKEQRPSGQPDVGYACRVKYVPIAGHKPDDEGSSFAKMSDIEIILRPIPSANVFVPYRVSVPTSAGTAVLKARRVDITTSSQQIALVH